MVPEGPRSNSQVKIGGKYLKDKAVQEVQPMGNYNGSGAEWIYRRTVGDIGTDIDDTQVGGGTRGGGGFRCDRLVLGWV